MWKKTFGLTLVLILALSVLAACSGGSDTVTSTEPVSVATNNAPPVIESPASPANENKATQVNYEPVEVNIVASKAVAPFYLAKEKGWFEEEFAKYNATVNWVVMASGTTPFEAILTDRVDFFLTGNTNVIAGQLADIPFKIISMNSVGQANVGILVPSGSNIKTVAELKGKKIAGAKATAAHDILLRLLNKAGLNANDIEFINLAPSEGRAAFVGGSVDAWVTVEPFYSQAIVNDGAVVIADGASINYTSPAFYIGRTKFLEKYPYLGVAFVTVIGKSILWENENFEDAVQIYAKQLEINPDVVRMVIDHVMFTARPLDEKYQAGQDELAKFLFDQGAIDAIPNTVEVTDNTYVKQAMNDLGVTEIVAIRP